MPGSTAGRDACRYGQACRQRQGPARLGQRLPFQLCFAPLGTTFPPHMNRIVLILLAASLAGLLSGSARAETETRSLECLKSARILAPIDSPDYRKYAPDRDVQPLPLALDLTPDFNQRPIAGQ